MNLACMEIVRSANDPSNFYYGERLAARILHRGFALTRRQGAHHHGPLYVSPVTERRPALTPVSMRLELNARIITEPLMGKLAASRKVSALSKNSLLRPLTCLCDAKAWCSAAPTPRANLTTRQYSAPRPRAQRAIATFRFAEARWRYYRACAQRPCARRAAAG